MATHIDQIECSDINVSYYDSYNNKIYLGNTKTTQNNKSQNLLPIVIKTNYQEIYDKDIILKIELDDILREFVDDLDQRMAFLIVDLMNNNSIDKRIKLKYEMTSQILNLNDELGNTLNKDIIEIPLLNNEKNNTLFYNENNDIITTDSLLYFKAKYAKFILELRSINIRNDGTCYLDIITHQIKLK
jgi:hypothetical protein